MRVSRFTPVLLGLAAVSACECNTALTDEPKPKAVLSHGTDTTPPAERLTVGLGSSAVGMPVTVDFTLRNEGNAPLNVSNIRFTGDSTLCPTPSGNFVIATPVSSARRFELGAGGSTDVQVRFVPASGAAECVVLSVESDDEKNPRLTALITGSGNAPRLCTDRAVIDLGNIEVGQVAMDTITLTSCGTRALTLEGMSLNTSFPPFEHDNVVFPAILEPTSTLQVPVRFRPTDAGQWNAVSGRAGQVTFRADTGEVYQVDLWGTSRLPPSCVLVAQPAGINFGTVTDMNPRMQDVVLSNIGERACTISSAEVAAPAGPFAAAFATFMAGGQLMPLETTTVRVTMTPPGTEGVFNGTLVVTSDDPQNPTLDIPLEVNLPGDVPCLLEIDPPTVNFGAAEVGSFRARGITVRNVGDDVCFLRNVGLAPGSSPAFINTSSSTGLLAAGATRTLTVGFRPSMQGNFSGRLRIGASDSLIGGTSFDSYVQLVGRTGVSGICVEPRALDFGQVNQPTTLAFNISACGSTAVTVTGLPFTQADAEFTLNMPPSFPFTLQPGQQREVRVTYAPADAQGDTARISVQSDDAVDPAVEVLLTGGPELVPVSAGRYLYYWQIPNAVTGGDVMKFPLQGNTTPAAFWGPRTGKACAGCHSISPDGKYVAVVEFAKMRFVEADSGLELNLVNSFLDPQYFSWRPNVMTTPPYQFAYSTSNVIKIASLFDGALRDLQGANDSSGIVQTMPSWGTTGKIAFVKGNAPAMSSQGNNVGLEGPTDILLVDENGGTAVPLQGASGNMMGNYYPQYSPNGLWIAFTQSAAAQSTVAATDAQIRLVRADNSGTVLPMTVLNGNNGASSYPTWARDGTFLSFSSQRSGGAGDWDIYLAPVDPVTGVDGPAQNVNALNTSAFEHAAQWSP